MQAFRRAPLRGFGNVSEVGIIEIRRKTTRQQIRRASLFLSALLLSALGSGGAHAARAEKLAVSRVVLDLPGPPAEILSTDLDHDGREDLLLVVAYTEWDRVTYDRVEDAVMITNVVPALFERREVRAFLTTDEGPFHRPLPPLDISSGVLAVVEGPPATGPLFLTGGGVSTLRLRTRAGDDDPYLDLEPFIASTPVFGGTTAFLPGLEVTADLDGDGEVDLLFPGEGGLEVHLSPGGTLQALPASRIPLPGDRMEAAGVRVRHYPLPIAGDLDGDGTVDLLFSVSPGQGEEFWLLRGKGQGCFAPAERLDLSAALSSSPQHDAKQGQGSLKKPEVAFIGDLDGDGRMEVVLSRMWDVGDAGLMKTFRAAKKPRVLFEFHHVGERLRVDAEPYNRLEAVGYGFGGGFPDVSAGAFRDLDGDGRDDLVTISLDFSLLQGLRVLAVKSLSVGLDFHVWRQGEGGGFEEIRNLDLSERLRFNLRRIRLGAIAQFAGDFDGDGRRDFVHLGRGRSVTVHRGQPRCRYPRRPDLTIPLRRAIDALELVRIDDFDGDGRDDLAITRPRKPDEEGETPPARLELLLSGGKRP